MGAKHRITEAPERGQPPTDPGARRTRSRSATVAGVACGSLLCAAGLAALAGNAAEPKKPSDSSAVTDQRPSGTLPVTQEGTLIAVSADSVTARSGNGYTRTYLVTPNTTVITGGGGQPAATAAHFTLNEQVAIVGMIQGGTALATAVADRDVGHGYGPPMDYVDGQRI